MEILGKFVNSVILKPLSTAREPGTRTVRLFNMGDGSLMHENEMPVGFFNHESRPVAMRVEKRNYMGKWEANESVLCLDENGKLDLYQGQLKLKECDIFLEL